MELNIFKDQQHFFSILFWTKEQKKLLESFHQKNPTIICGDYGTGKTVVLFSAVESLLKEGNEVLFINANDNTDKQDYKTWEDVLDVTVRSRFKAGVTFLNMGALRKERQNQNMCTLDLIINYISDNSKDKTVCSMYEYIKIY